jgi:hypothetical protein
MLRLILDRAGELAIPTESMFLGDFAHVRCGSMDLSAHAQAVRFARQVWEHPKVALWELEGEAPVPPMGLSHEDAYRWCVSAPYEAFAARDGKPRWGDKTPYYLAWIDELKAVWPDARIVELVRDGRDVALSIMPLPFGGNNAWVAGGDWARGIRDGQQAHARYPGDVHTVVYEQLTADPEPHVRGVCEFLGVEFHRGMLDVEKTDQRRIVADQAEWFTNLWAGINQTSVGKWRTKMSPRAQAVFAAAAGPELAAHGYEAGEHAGTVRVGAVRGAGYQIANFGVRLRNFVRLRLVQERGRELRYVLRRKLFRS